MATVENSSFIQNKALGGAVPISATHAAGLSGGGAILVYDGSSLTVKGSHFIANQAPNGGAISNASFTYAGLTRGSTLAVMDSMFVNNQAIALNGSAVETGDGGAIISKGWAFTGGSQSYGGTNTSITNSAFKNNITANNGGAVYCSNSNSSDGLQSGQISMTANTLKHNVASGSGGGVAIDNATASMYSNIISKNLAAYFGAQLYLHEATVNDINSDASTVSEMLNNLLNANNIFSNYESGDIYIAH